MKKLMIAAAVAAVGFGASAIESANVVGFNQQNTGANPNITGGVCFKTPGAAGDTFALDDIVLAGSTYAADWIQFLDPATSIVDPTKSATYYSLAEATADNALDDIGWYDVDDNYVGDSVYPVGTAFLASFLSSSVSVTFAGEVLTGETTIDCTGKPNAFIANVCPKALVADDVKLVGSTYAADWIQFLDPATSIVDPTKSLTYYSLAEATADNALDDIGWYDVDDNYAGDQVIAAGSGFLCSFLSSGVSVVFPSAL